MSDESFTVDQLIDRDPRFPIEAYAFVREALSYAADALEMGSLGNSEASLSEEEQKQIRHERHLTGQELCEAIRLYALNQFGYMSKVVLGCWGIQSTGDFGDIVYNMIDIGLMKKSAKDQRSHFDDVYEFEDVFDQSFEMCNSVGSPINVKDSLDSDMEL